MMFETVWGPKTTSLFWNKANNLSSFIGVFTFLEKKKTNPHCRMGIRNRKEKRPIVVNRQKV